MKRHGSRIGLLVFLRHYNDIDHVTPVIWKWVDSGHGAVRVVLSANERVLADYRVRLLQSLPGVDVRLCDTFMPEAVVRQRVRFETHERMMRRLAALPAFHPRRLWYRFCIFRYGEPLKPREYLYYPDLARTLLDLPIEGERPQLVVMDWVHGSSGLPLYLRFARAIRAETRRRGIPMVALPHGDEPHKCRLLRRDENKYSDADISCVNP